MTTAAALGWIGRKLRLNLVLRADPAILDSALASAMNLLSVLAIGAIYGVSTLGEFSLVLIYSSLVYLFAYNFIIIPATSASWSICKVEFAQKVLVISVITFTPLTLMLLAVDEFVLKFSEQNVFLTFFYIVSHNAFLTLRRIVLHLRMSRYPTLIPLLSLSLITLFSWLEIFSYQWFVLSYSLSFVVMMATTVLGKSAHGLMLDIALAIQFLKFSRWMAFGIWFQWLSGNLVQLFVQYHNGTAALGELRILLSSFGFLSFYFQYQEIVLAREYGSEPNPRFSLASVFELRRYLVPSLLILLCLPIYATYSFVVGTPSFLGPALLYAVYQFFVLVSIIMRVYLRLMNDMLYSSIGYFTMVLVLLMADFIYVGPFQMKTAAFLYFVSIIAMVFTLALGLTRVSKRQI